MCRRIATAFCLFFTLIAVVLALVVWDITRPGPSRGPAGPGRGAAPGPAPQKGQEREQARGLEKERESAARRVVTRLREDHHRKNAGKRPDRPRTLELQLTEAEMNDLIRGLPQVRKTLNAQRLKELEVDFSPDQLRASTRIPIAGEVEGRVSATIRLWARAGRLAYELTDARIGSFPAPPAARKQLEQQLSVTVKQLNADFRGRIDKVTLTDDRLTVIGEVDAPS